MTGKFTPSWTKNAMSLTCSAVALPEIDRADEFPLLNPVFEFTYQNPTNVLHLYGYAGRIRIDSREYRLRPGDLTCIQAGSIYSIQSESPGKHWCIHFRASAEGGATFELPDLVSLGANSLVLREQIRKIASLVHCIGVGAKGEWIHLEARHRLKVLLLSIHNLLEQGGRLSTRTNLDWERLLSWIEEHLDRPVSTAEVARLAGVGTNTLARRFKQRHLATLGQYVLLKRIDRAKSLLETTTLTVNEIGASVGIGDPQYFNKQFRKVAGLSPSRYREARAGHLDTVATELAVKEGSWERK
jgi:AraC-like DNA-binding protein